MYFKSKRKAPKKSRNINWEENYVSLTFFILRSYHKSSSSNW